MVQAMTFGAKMRTLMDERGISLRKLAATIPANHGYLSKVSRNLKTPSKDMAVRIDEALHAGGQLAALRAEPNTRRPQVIPEIQMPAMDDRPADTRFVEVLRETNQALIKLDTLHGGDEVYPLARRVFREAHRKLGTGAYDPGIERDLIAATGETGEVAAWLAFDTDRQNTSRQIIHEALLLSRQAGDRDMELMELSHLAMQSVHLHRPAEALRISESVLDSGNHAPRVTAVFAIRQGRALAQLGDAARAFNALDRARSALAEGIGSRDPYWTWWASDAEVSWHEAMSHAELGDWGASVEPFQEAARQRTPYRRARYNDEVHLLNALVHVDAWTDAEQVIHGLASQAGQVGSTRTTNLLSRVVDRIGRVSAPSAVADVAAGLRRLLAADESDDHYDVTQR